MQAARGILLLVAGLLLASCGPVNAATHVIDSREALKDAQKAQAEFYAPYEYAKSKAYLKKAKEKSGYSEWQVSVLYSLRSKDLAFDAVKIAKDNAGKEERKKKLLQKIQQLKAAQ